MFSLPSCTQLLSMFVWVKKCFNHHCVAGWGFVFFVLFFLFFSLVMWLSKSVLVGCFKFQCSVGCETSSFLLTTAPSSLFDFLFAFTPLRCSFLLTRGRAHKKKRKKEIWRLCNKEIGVDMRTAGGRKYLLCCSVPRRQFLRHTKCGGC